MEATPTVVATDRLREGVMITFADGKSAFFPNLLLYAACDLASIMSESTEEPD